MYNQPVIDYCISKANVSILLRSSARKILACINEGHAGTYHIVPSLTGIGRSSEVRALPLLRSLVAQLVCLNLTCDHVFIHFYRPYNHLCYLCNLGKRADAACSATYAPQDSLEPPDFWQMERIIQKNPGLAPITIELGDLASSKCGHPVYALNLCCDGLLGERLDGGVWKTIDNCRPGK